MWIDVCHICHFVDGQEPANRNGNGEWIKGEWVKGKESALLWFALDRLRRLRRRQAS